MTREKAIEISRALDAVDSFECVMDIMESAIIKSEESGIDIKDFKIALRQLMVDEYNRRKKVLEEI